ncbi:hypothetical protein [Oceanisphaera sp. W20_SRM_FM3]|uniref:hypothetical protein n=1 Tax=Oceanisphaera sp. W20_SRM_FM3 TaxID=3240267 RepID=UPI003F9B9D7A
MTPIWIKKTPLCLALALFALPAMADNIFSGVVNFGREILDETRKLAPGIQNDRRTESPADVRSALNDGRDRPAIEMPSSNQASNNQSGNHQPTNNLPSVNQAGNTQQSYNQNGSRQSNIEVAPPVNGQPTGSNLNYTYGESQRSKTSRAANAGANANNNAVSNHSVSNSASSNNGYNDNRHSDGNSGANDNYGSSDSYNSNQGNNQGQQQQAPPSNFGWQEESNL